jgi:hypothetical protein
MGTTSSLAVVTMLGYAGLIPFVCTALLVVSISPYASLSVD